MVNFKSGEYMNTFDSYYKYYDIFFYSAFATDWRNIFQKMHSFGLSFFTSQVTTATLWCLITLITLIDYKDFELKFSTVLVSWTVAMVNSCVKKGKKGPYNIWVDKH